MSRRCCYMYLRVCEYKPAGRVCMQVVGYTHMQKSIIEQKRKSIQPVSESREKPLCYIHFFILSLFLSPCFPYMFLYIPHTYLSQTKSPSKFHCISHIYFHTADRPLPFQSSPTTPAPLSPSSTRTFTSTCSRNRANSTGKNLSSSAIPFSSRPVKKPQCPPFL